MAPSAARRSIALNLRTRRSQLVVEVGATALIVGAIWAYTVTAQSYLVISLPDMLIRFREVWLFDRFSSDLVPSLKRAFAGYSIAVFVGIGFGLLVGLSPIVRAVTYPVISFLRAIPPIALIPPAIIVLGIGDIMPISIIAFICIWPIALNVAEGTTELDQTMMLSARAYGLRGLERLRFVILPAISPRIFTGMRTSLAFAVLLLVTSELIASTNGIGSFVSRAQQRFEIADMWAGIIMLALLGFLLNYGLSAVERRVIGWHLMSSGEAPK